MGNYKDLEYEFVERTLALIRQYETFKHNFDFNEQFDHTLLINCLLGLIVLPKEKTQSYIPRQRLTKEYRKEIGLEYSILSENVVDLRQLILKLRNAVAHFDIIVESHDERFLIDEIIFRDEEDGISYEVIRFKSNELIPFLRYYGDWLLSNLKKFRDKY